MDFLATIIERKKSQTEDVMTIVSELLKEIIQYEKLSVNERFRDISNPVVAKKCPRLSKLTETNSYEYTILQELLPALVDFTGRSIGTLTLIEQSKRDKILNQTYGFHLHIYDLLNLSQEPTEYIAITESVDGQNKLMVIVPNGKGVNLYIGKLNIDNTVNRNHINPLIHVDGSDNIHITSYSKMGNNDYVFGFINNKPIRIRGHKLIVSDNEYEIDPATLAFCKDEHAVATYLLNIYKEVAR